MKDNNSPTGSATQGNGNNVFLPPDFFNGNGGGKYFQLQDGKNHARLIPPFYYGKSQWWQDNEGKWHVSRCHMADIPANADPQKSIKKWFGCKVLDRVTGEVKLWFCEQVKTAEQIQQIAREEGSVTDRDTVIRKSGKDKTTTYSVSVLSPTELTAEEQTIVDQFYVNWDKVYNNENPFTETNENEENQPWND